MPGVPAKDGNGFYPYILSLSQAEKNFTAYKIYYASTTSEVPEKGLMKKLLFGKKKEKRKNLTILVGIGLNIHIQMVQQMRMILKML